MSELQLNIDSKYQAAIATHAHYDNLSLAIVTGMILLTYAAIAFDPVGDVEHKGTLTCIMALFVLALLGRLYRNCARSALIARNLAAAIENQSVAHGVSYVSINIKKQDFEKFRPSASVGIGTGSQTINLLEGLLMLTLVIAAIVRW